MSAPSGREPEDLRDLLAAYALDAVDDVERRAVERLLADDEDAAREVASLRATAAELGAVGALDPPPGLRADVLDALDRTPQEGRAPSARGVGATGAPRPVRADGRPRPVDRAPRHRRGLGRLSLAVAAAAAALVAVPSVVAWQEHERAVEAEARGAALTEALTEPGATLVREDVAGGGVAVAVLTDERALLLAHGLPALDEDRVYQLWAMRDGVPVDAGLVEVQDGTVQAVADEYRQGDGLALSVEPAGGSEQPTTTPVVVLLPG